jgi:hypothetical protein
MLNNGKREVSAEYGSLHSDCFLLSNFFCFQTFRCGGGGRCCTRCLHFKRFFEQIFIVVFITCLLYPKSHINTTKSSIYIYNLKTNSSANHHGMVITIPSSSQPRSRLGAAGRHATPDDAELSPLDTSRPTCSLLPPEHASFTRSFMRCLCC